MADVTTSDKRSRMMAGIKSKNTRPERQLRNQLFRAGFRYRLHSKNLPGTPDLWFAKYRAVLEINGCFWHGHGCHLFRLPSTRTDFWKQKIESNRQRDRRHLVELDQMRIRRLTIWECALKGKTKHDSEQMTTVVGWWLRQGDGHAEISGGQEIQDVYPVR